MYVFFKYTFNNFYMFCVIYFLIRFCNKILINSLLFLAILNISKNDNIKKIVNNNHLFNQKYYFVKFTF